MLLMMGFWAFYNGWIYNDFMYVPLNLFGSCYEEQHIEDEMNQYKWIQKDENCVYLFSIDPVWMCVPNELTFMNSYKMKLAVIIGVIHMSFGILLKGFSAIINFLYILIWMDGLFNNHFGVLMMMDFMECFLHTLSLHWVEFQNKFFKADGYTFQKCSYFKVIEENIGLKE